jgi:hypothetical protein
VQAVFSEAVTQASAENMSNYAITYPTNQQVPIQGAFLEADGKTVSLTVASPLAYNTVYTLTASNVASTTGTLITPNSQATFQFAKTGTGTILRQYWTGIAGEAVSNLTTNVNYPNNPSGSDQRTSFEAPTDWNDAYGTRMRGYVTAPMTGTYVFWIASDDSSELWFNRTDDNPNGTLTKIAWVGGWTSPRAWSQESNQCSSNAYGTITLQAGLRYYIEALQKEGGGGDNLAVGWQLPDGTLERPIPGLRLTPYSAAPTATASIAATDPNAAEKGCDPGTFTITRTGTTTSALRVYYTVAGTARSNDYTPSLSGYVDMAANVTSASITITPVADTAEEYDETLSLILKLSTNYNIDGNGLATVVIADDELPTVTSVKLNGSTTRGVSSVDPSGAGVKSVTVRFREPVLFGSTADDVLVQKVAFSGDIETILGTVTPTSVAGSGTDTMTITLPAGVVDTWVKVTLSSGGTTKDLQNHSLDGEPKSSGSGRGYLYSYLDMPTGNGVAGGSTVFYVGSLRGDFSGDGAVTANDKAGFLAAWNAKSLDADFRGVGFGVRPPDGRITLGDIDGFTSAYLAAVALGRHLDLLPTTGGPLSGKVIPLPPLSTSLPETDILAEAAGQLPLDQQAPLAAMERHNSFSDPSDEETLDLLRVRRAQPATAAEGSLSAILRL